MLTSSISTLRRVCAALGIDMADLLRPTSTASDAEVSQRLPDATGDPMLDERFAELLNVLESRRR